MFSYRSKLLVLGNRTKIFDHATDSVQLAAFKKASRSAIVIVDGVFLYKRELNDYWGLRVLLETSDDVAIERGAKRDTIRFGSYEAARQKYIDRYIASQTIYYDEEKPEQKADVIIDNNSVNMPTIIQNT